MYGLQICILKFCMINDLVQFIQIYGWKGQSCGTKYFIHSTEQVTKGLVQTYTFTEDTQLTSVPWFPLFCYPNHKCEDDCYSQNQYTLKVAWLQLYILNSPPNIIGMIKSRRMRLAQNVAYMGQNRYAFKASVANSLKETDHWHTYT